MPRSGWPHSLRSCVTSVPVLDQVPQVRGTSTASPTSTAYAALKESRLPGRQALYAMVEAWQGDRTQWLFRRGWAETGDIPPAEYIVLDCPRRASDTHGDRDGVNTPWGFSQQESTSSLEKDQADAD